MAGTVFSDGINERLGGSALSQVVYCAGVTHCLRRSTSSNMDNPITHMSRNWL